MVDAIRNGITAFLFMIFVGWYAGIDMLQRGSEQAVTLLCAVLVAAGVFIVSAPTSLFFGVRK